MHLEGQKVLLRWIGRVLSQACAEISTEEESDMMEVRETSNTYTL